MNRKKSGRVKQGEGDKERKEGGGLFPLINATVKKAHIHL